MDRRTFGRSLGLLVAGDRVDAGCWASTNTGAEGRPMPKNIKHGNRTCSRTRARVGHPLADQKDRMGLFIRTIDWSSPRQGQNRDGQSRRTS
ncbi:hypothetical protein [Mesorhizobium sp. M0185]|uniref:hypothetical protein n=1 Tax=Mesorhizobium sp. M0185 TaxID=2956907 RepID=UPI00333BA6DD